MALISQNPATEQIIKTYDEMTIDEVNKILGEVQSEWEEWKTHSFQYRAEKIKRVAELLRGRKDEYGRIMSLEMGKPFAQAKAEAEKSAWVCDYYADNAEAFLSPKPVETGASKSYVTFEPIGIVLAVMPWNFPFWQVFRYAAPTLIAGNACVLKHASNVQGSAFAIEEIFRKAGLPQNLFRNLCIGSSMVADVMENPLIKAVTLTGSTPAGKAVAAKAGELLKKTVLELGGSDPYIVLEDADLEQAAEACVEGRMLNTGQSCIAAKRFIVTEPIKEDFEVLVVRKMGQKRMGDPFKEGVDVGPMVSIDAREELDRQVQASMKAGAIKLLGGKVVVEHEEDDIGAFYQPTVLTNVTPGMPAFDEELFGPVAVIISAKDEEDAIRLANQTSFGLGAAVFTRDIEKGERIAKNDLDAGCCFVNDFVRSDPRLPFGGVKESGYGRELGEFGIYEFVNIKTVFVR